MKKILKILAIALLAIMLSCCGNEGHPKIKLVRTEFGTINKDPDGVNRITETNIIPYKVQQMYGWMIQYESDKPIENYEEILILPEKGNWEMGNDLSGKPRNYKIIMDGKGVVLKQINKNNSLITGGWGISKGDPAGKYILRIVVDGITLHEFNFELKPIVEKER